MSLTVTQWVEQQARCFGGCHMWVSRDVMGAFLVVQNISIL